MKKKWLFELTWWLFTAVVTAIVLLPVYSRIPAYPFWLSNIIFIVSFITLTRYIFFLPHTFLARRQVLKIALVFLIIPLIFYFVEGLNRFQTVLDEEGVEAIVGSLPFTDQNTMIDYIRSEMLLFGVGSVISGIIFPFRMIMSVWRQRNQGKS